MQNFRAKPGTRMAGHPEPELDDHLWTRGRADRAPRRCTSRRRRTSRSPKSRGCSRGHRRLGRCVAGDDRPRQPGGAVAGRGAARGGDAEPRARARRAAARLPGVRRRRPGSTRRCCRRCCARRTCPGSRARGAGRPARRRAPRRSRRRDAPPLELTATSWARTSSRASSRRGRGAATGLRRGRPAPPRGLRRRGHVRRDAERPVHERLLLPLRLLRLLEGQARGEPARPRLPRPGRGDRAPRRGGVGARRDRDLPPGRDPPGVHGRTTPRSSRDQGGGVGDPRARVLRAGDLAGRGDARVQLDEYLARLRDLGLASLRARRPRCSTTRCER